MKYPCNKSFVDFFLDSRNISLLIYFYLCISTIITSLDVVFNRSFSTYTLGFHFLDYTLGFIARGLYAESLGKITYFLPFELYSVYWMIVILLPITFIFIIYKLRNAKRESFAIIDYLMFFVACLPTTLLPAVDFFRLDVLNLFFFLISVYLLWNNSKFSFFVPFLVIYMVLVHEASIFMFIPTICGVAIYRIKKTQDIIITILLILSSLVAIYLYWLGRNVNVDYSLVNEIINKNCLFELENKLNIKDHFSSIRKGYFNYLINVNLSSIWLGGVIFSIPFIFMTMQIINIFWVKIYSKIKQEENKKLYLQNLILFVAPFSNLLLFIGCDFNRWLWSWLWCEIFIMLLFFTEKENCEIKVSYNEKRKIIVYGIILFLLGPGNHYSYTYFSTILGWAMANAWEKAILVFTKVMIHFF